MGLETSGIDLQAKGFRKYIKNLDAIEKKERKVFETEFKGTEKSFAQIQKAAKAYEKELKAVANAEKKAQQSAEKLANAQVKAANKARAAQKKQADERKQAGRAQVSGGFQTLGTGDIKGGISGIAGGLKAIGPAAAVATGGLAVVATGAVATTVAVAAIGVGVLNVAKDTDQASKQIAASLGISAPEAAEKYNKSLQAIFVDNPQAQFGEIAEAIALTQRALDGVSPAGVEQVAGDALKISKQFGEDLPKTIGATEQLIEQFGLTGQQATDLLAFGLQNISADDLIDSIGEFSGTFAQQGFSAEEFFSSMISGAAGGVLGVDKASDAVKEFNIRFTEGNKSLKDSFTTLGLSFDGLTSQVNTGALSQADVYKKVIGRIKEVDLGLVENRAAVAGLGTQFEDLGPKAVAALDLDAINLDDVIGAIDKLDERFNNLGDAFTSIKRGALVALAPIGEVILKLANSIVPKIKAGFEAVRPSIEAFAARIVPAIEFASDALGRLSKSFGGAATSASLFEKTLNGTATVIEAIAGGIEILARAAETFRQILAFAKAGAAAFGSVISQTFFGAIETIGSLGRALLKFVKLDFAGAAEEVSKIDLFPVDLDKVEKAAVDAFLGVAVGAKETTEAIEEIGDIDPGTLTEPFDEQSDAVKLSEEALKSYQNALKQAEELQRSFAREAEDTALKLARANEDIARKQTKSVKDLEDKQTSDRDKLLQDQTKQFDDFKKDRKKQIASAEDDLRQARTDAAEQQKRDEKKLRQDLKQARDRFDLSQLQSTRRFDLQESRLRAEGDILGLKELREDFTLQQTEEKENFDQSKKEQVLGAKEQQKNQSKDLESKLKTLKENLETERAELLTSFDTQLAQQVVAQAEARSEQQRGFEEAAAERAIQLAREEEDRRISQARQLEDLGRSFAEQEGITAEGSLAIAGELEKVFGIDGVADSIMTGFTEKTENEFTNLFDNLEAIVTGADLEPDVPEIKVPMTIGGGGGFGKRIGGVQELAEGGIVGGPGPIGSPQVIVAHKGENVQTMQQQQSFTMSAPIIPSQNLNVEMSGGFDIRGGQEAGEVIVKAAVAEMTENIRIAVRRLARRN